MESPGIEVEVMRHVFKNLRRPCTRNGNADD